MAFNLNSGPHHLGGDLSHQIVDLDRRQFELFRAHEPHQRVHRARQTLDFKAHRLQPRFDWSAARTLHFGEIDVRRYPCFAVVLETARSGDLGAMVGLSAADELAVERFLRGDIPFTDIAELLRRGADLGAKAKRSRELELDEIIAIDALVRASLTTSAAAV